MNPDQIYSILLIMELELGYLRTVYWQYKAGSKTKEDLIVAYNKFRSSVSSTLNKD